ncbi:2OG-Fe(II) oxygenase incomplete domain containing protein [Pandoravirus salinus]|uniref:2OG-Fe(II) oxygenase incomplete domain containing protein n=1 Tax=Pandoravirus salinus TaxID=1349410 RepID=S4W260_9VIRU|nr:2OG-Fe(II) oxygenase incomplete domain [Pandoravirus salinus]AGO85896.2 2OG-Fe(II) oxygenase incomplete domain containing protein [Pandoravirus salinus]
MRTCPTNRQPSMDTSAQKDNLDVAAVLACDPDPDWLLHLRQRGWTVVPALDQREVEHCAGCFFSWLESCVKVQGAKVLGPTGFRRDQPSTWTRKNMPAAPRGIFKSGFVDAGYETTDAHAPPDVWRWRLREQCAPIFASALGIPAGDLLCSMDGGCFMPPDKSSRPWRPWFHQDMPRALALDPTAKCIQGVVTLTDSTQDDDGGLVVLEGSHLVHAQYVARHEQEGVEWRRADCDDPLLAGRRQVRVGAPAGSLILFDSRLFHCNRPPTGDRPRMCVYVSMQPRSSADSSTLAERVRIYEAGLMTGHWCYGPWMRPNASHVDSTAIGRLPKTIVVPRSAVAVTARGTLGRSVLTPLAARLVGYD